MLPAICWQTVLPDSVCRLDRTAAEAAVARIRATREDSILISCWQECRYCTDPGKRHCGTFLLIYWQILILQLTPDQLVHDRYQIPKERVMAFHCGVLHASACCNFKQACICSIPDFKTSRCDSTLSLHTYFPPGIYSNTRRWPRWRSSERRHPFLIVVQSKLTHYDILTDRLNRNQYTTEASRDVPAIRPNIRRYLFHFRRLICRLTEK